ncbi:MAG: tetratricopeptide repeat protein [Chloroflexi bacterium]|nr:tetratricopeptide repeat protein [Chloroflexota bacterium]
MVRDDFDRAASILNEVLEMAPLDTTIRTELIGLLEQQGRQPEAMPHYLHLGRTFRQLGNVDGAREALSMAHALCKRFTDDAEQLVAIKHQIADIDMTRFDLRRAQRTFEEILEIRPHDERARRQLIDIHFRAGEQQRRRQATRRTAVAVRARKAGRADRPHARGTRSPVP